MMCGLLVCEIKTQSPHNRRWRIIQPHPSLLKSLMKLMRIKAQRMRDAGASRTLIRNPILIMENSDSEGCETLEIPNIFIFPSILSFITILIWSCFILERFISPC